MSDGLPDDEYVAGDPERLETVPKVQFKSERAGPPYWRALTGNERISIVRWLRRGDAGYLLRALALNPISPGLRGFVAEGLAGGPQTGWRLRLAARGSDRSASIKHDREAVTVLRTALAVGDADVSMLAAQLASRMNGERARRGRFTSPARAAVVGLDYELAFYSLKSSKLALYSVACLYGQSEKNIERLLTAFRREGGE